MQQKDKKILNALYTHALLIFIILDNLIEGGVENACNKNFEKVLLHKNTEGQLLQTMNRK